MKFPVVYDERSDLFHGPFRRPEVIGVSYRVINRYLSKAKNNNRTNIFSSIDSWVFDTGAPYNVKWRAIIKLSASLMSCQIFLYVLTVATVCSGFYTGYYLLLRTVDPEVPGSSPEWVLIFCEARSTVQGSPEPSSLRSRLGTRTAEYEDCNWGMQIDWWLQPTAVFGNTSSGIVWHMLLCWESLFKI